MEWLERTLGRGFEPRPLPTPTAEWSLEPAGSSDLLLRADEVLRACPTWLDRSPLTFELAEEVCLREGRVAVDPHRDSGAFRFLFEHRIIHRLELYRRMLLWMHWFWQLCRGAGARRVCADPGVAALGRAVCRAVSSFHGGTHGSQPGRSSRATGTKDDPRPARRVS